MRPIDTHAGYLVGLDAGQTSMKAILAHLDGRPPVYAHGGPVDHFAQSGARSHNEAVMRETIDALCRAADIATDAIAAVATGWTSIRPRMPEIQIVESILADILPRASVTVLPDYVVSLAGASGGNPGIVVIAGGGSIAYGVASDGRDAVVGGMGYLLGDEGSAYDIGRRALNAAARSSDGRGRQTALVGLILETFEVTEVRDITRLVYAQGFSRSRIANLASLVAGIAEAGDVVAGEIMTHAGQELGRAGAAVAITLGMEAPHVYAAGGVFSAGEIVLRPFRRALEAAVPRARVCRPEYSPVVGALLLARRAMGLPDDPDWLSKQRDEG